MGLSSAVTNIPVRQIPTADVVAKIIAGSNVTVSPASGTGDVTISCTGGSEEGGAIACPILTPMWIDYKADDAGWVLSDDDGTEYTKLDYQKIYTHLEEDYSAATAIAKTQTFVLADSTSVTITYREAEDGHKICEPSQRDSLDKLIEDANIGCAWFFIIDTTNETFVLPRTKYGFHGERDYAHTDEAETGKMLLHFSTGVSVIEAGGVGGGVINGELWFTPTAFTKTFTSGVTQVIYTVQNDCGLYIKMSSVPVAGTIQFFIDGKPIFSAIDVAGNGQQGHGTVIPVARGAKIQALVTESTVTTHTFTCYEYKLSSLTPQYAFPNWDTAKRSSNLVSTLSSGSTYAVTDKGFLYCNLCVDGGIVNVLVNGVNVASWYNLLSGEAADFCSHIIPVSVGDKVTMTRTVTTAPSTGSEIYFYPAKSVFSTVEAETKADKCVPSTANNIALLDATGNLTDSGKALSSLATTAALSTVEQNLRYDLKSIDSGDKLFDRAVNCVSISGATTVIMPDAVEGKVRDFIITVSVVNTGTFSVNNQDGTSFTSYMYDENDDDPFSQTYAAGETYQFYFTESVAANKFRVACTKLTDPS